MTIAPTTAPKPRLISKTPISLTVAWDEIPCSMRNGRIKGYVFTLYSVMGQVINSIPQLRSNNIRITNLIPRSMYSIEVTAYTELNSRSLFGPKSSRIFVSTGISERQLVILLCEL